MNASQDQRNRENKLPSNTKHTHTHVCAHKSKERSGIAIKINNEQWEIVWILNCFRNIRNFGCDEKFMLKFVDWKMEKLLSYTAENVHWVCNGCTRMISRKFHDPFHNPRPIKYIEQSYIPSDQWWPTMKLPLQIIWLPSTDSDGVRNRWFVLNVPSNIVFILL